MQWLPNPQEAISKESDLWPRFRVCAFLASRNRDCGGAPPSQSPQRRRLESGTPLQECRAVSLSVPTTESFHRARRLTLCQPPGQRRQSAQAAQLRAHHPGLLATATGTPSSRCSAPWLQFARHAHTRPAAPISCSSTCADALLIICPFKWIERILIGVTKVQNGIGMRITFFLQLNALAALEAQGLVKQPNTLTLILQQIQMAY